VKLGRISGTVVSTIQHPSLDGHHLRVVDLLDVSGAPTGGYVIAVDSIGASHGQTVLVLDEGSSARQVMADTDAPVRAIVVGIVDEIRVDGIDFDVD
jgi:ethanolamine utilization protein EutN